MSVSNILLKTGANAGKIDPIYIVGGGGGGGVASVTASAGAFVDNTDQLNPIVGVGTLVAGDLVVGTAVPHIGAVLQQGANGTFLGVAGGALGYQAVGGSGTITGTAPLTEYAIGAASNLAIDFVAKGDLIVGGGAQVGGHPIAGNVLPIGADTAVLTADSTGTGGVFGMKWELPTPVTGGQVMRITTPGTTAIPSPTTQNQQLQLIDIASTTNSFLYEPGAPCPNANFIPAGSFTNTIGGQFTLIVYGNDPTTNPAAPVGQVWGYIPNTLVAANGVWYKWIETNGVGDTIVSGCCLTQFNTTFGGDGTSDMVFSGQLTDISFYGSLGLQTLAGLQNFFYWELTPELVVNPGFTTFSINPYPKGGVGVAGMPQSGQAGAIKFIAYALGDGGKLLVNTPSGVIDYNGFAMITKTLPVVAAIVPIYGGVPVGAQPNGIFGYNPTSAGGLFINYINWCFNGVMCISGLFNSCVLNGATVGYSCWIGLEYDPTPNSINGFQIVATPTNPGVPASQGTFQQVNNLYDPSQGVSVMGDFQFGSLFNIAIMTLLGGFLNVDNESPGSGFTNGLMIDGGSYLGVLDFAGQILGLENGYSAVFGIPQSLWWFIPKINQGYPVSYIGMAGKKVFQGYFKIVAAQTTISFPTAKLRYALSSGTTGLADFAVLNSIYSSMTLIGDIPPPPAAPEWDLVAMTGNISFS